jgi:hypothetical protein
MLGCCPHEVVPSTTRQQRINFMATADIRCIARPPK